MEVSVDSKAVTKALIKVQKDLEKTVNLSLKDSSKKVVSQAKTRHRFKSQTGNLVRSTKAEIKKMVAEYSIDTKKANYGGYIHDGFKGWSPDPYLLKSIEDNESKIAKELEEAMYKSFKKAGF